MTVTDAHIWPPFPPFWDCCLNKTPYVLSSTLLLFYCRAAAIADGPLFVSAMRRGRVLVDLDLIRGTLSFGPLASFATRRGLLTRSRKAMWNVEKC